jgi:hypothetical protein
MGAGVAASMNNGALVRRTYTSTVQAQQALAAQNHAVAQYLKMGTQFQLKQQWDNAEKAFTYVLQVIARRDGPGSPKGVPALKHLAEICTAQNKLDKAISFQKTVLAFTKADKKTDNQVLIKEQECLSNLFIAKSDYASAEPVLRNTVALYKQTPSSSSSSNSQATTNNYTRTLRVYGTVLRQLNKTDEAAQVELQIDEQQTASASGSDTVANTPPLVGSSPSLNTPTTPSITDAGAAPGNGSSVSSAISTIKEGVSADTSRTIEEASAETPQVTVQIGSSPIPAQAADKKGQDNTIAATPPDSASSNLRTSSKESANPNSNAQASNQADPESNTPDTSLLPAPSSLSPPEPELIPMPLPMPDGTTQPAR